MAYNELLANRVREALIDFPDVEEKKMFKGITFMVDGKMCVSVSGDELMCRVDPMLTDEILERNGCRAMIHSGKIMKGFVYVDQSVLKNTAEFDYFINLCKAYNKVAKAAKSKKKA
ncbi:hypothetical protein C3K47_16080 [Solitalea longa]|uniref:TfoX N-terminal domain-containing protein n=1 Tax=Solitalea longa TaxID=2079460 RepID=A0A2S4ZY68_9SPHI|nr:TfoX/Sxy family protein [Solitalea longa]POY35301.1 hypothetical protein C3K47_16080 [Solitalea longa]